MITTKLVRTKGGGVVHRSTCPLLGASSAAIGWQWAEGRSLSEIRAAIAMVGARACLRCGPGEEMYEPAVSRLAPE